MISGRFKAMPDKVFSCTVSDLECFFNHFSACCLSTISALSASSFVIFLYAVVLFNCSSNEYLMYVSVSRTYASRFLSAGMSRMLCLLASSSSILFMKR